MTPKPWTERQSGECAWPIGPRDQILSCCSPVAPGSFYCPTHYAVMYQTQSPEAKVRFVRVVGKLFGSDRRCVKSSATYASARG